MTRPKSLHTPYTLLARARYERGASSPVHLSPRWWGYMAVRLNIAAAAYEYEGDLARAKQCRDRSRECMTRTRGHLWASESFAPAWRQRHVA